MIIKNMKGCFLGLNRKEWYNIQTMQNLPKQWLGNKQISKYLFSTCYSKSSSIYHYTYYTGSWIFKHILKSNCVYKQEPQKIVARKFHTPWVQLNRHFTGQRKAHDWAHVKDETSHSSLGPENIAKLYGRGTGHWEWWRAERIIAIFHIIDVPSLSTFFLTAEHLQTLPPQVALLV